MPMPKIAKTLEDLPEASSGLFSDIFTDSEIALKASTKFAKKLDSSGRQCTMHEFEADSDDFDIYLDNLPLQYVAARKQIATGTLVEIIGEDGVGKTTFALSLVGMGLRQKPYAVALYLNAEGKNKLFDRDRIASCLSTNMKQAEELMQRVRWCDVSSLNQSLGIVASYCRLIRENFNKKGIPEDVSPIYVVVDTLSKLMPKSEAELLGFGEKASASSADVLMEDSSKLEFATAMQKWTRLVKTIMESNNACFLVVSHQNTKIEMNSFAARFLTSAAMKEDNRTKIGGNAVNQSATIQFTLTKGKPVVRETSTTKTVIGKIVKLKAVKNSSCIDSRSCPFYLNMDHSEDTDTDWVKPIDFNYGLPDVFAQTGLYGVKVASTMKDTFSSKPLQLENVDRKHMIEVLSSEEIMREAPIKLYIRGYSRRNPAKDFPVEENQVLEPTEDTGDPADIDGTSVVGEENFEDVETSLEEESPKKKRSSDKVVVSSTTTSPKRRGRKPKNAQEPDL